MPGSSQQTTEKRRKRVKPNAAETFTDVEENILYEKNLHGISNAEALLSTVWLLNSVHFGLRGCEEHRQMTWGDVNFTWKLTELNA